MHILHRLCMHLKAPPADNLGLIESLVRGFVSIKET